MGAASKHKGSKFERELCTALSLWISGGKHDDLLWRSAISGGRATNRVAKHGAQKVSGDICSVGEGGHVLTDFWHIEAKHVRDMAFTAFALRGKGFLANEWRRCQRQARSHGKLPMLIAKQNLYPAVVITDGIGYGAMTGCFVNLFAQMVSSPYTIPRFTFTVQPFSLKEEAAP